VVAALAVLRSFVLLSNASLLFGIVPTITMLALVGSANLNAEVPLFFGVLILGSLFLCGYEGHLRRASASGRPAGPALPYLLAAWLLTLTAGAIGLVFPLLIQPVLRPLSPFGLPAINQWRQLQNFTRMNASEVPVGQGPIQLSRAPLFEVRAEEPGLLRTQVFTDYTGRGWRGNPMHPTVPVVTTGGIRELGEDSANRTYRLHEFSFPPDPDREVDVPVRRVKQQVRTLGYMSPGVPGLGRIVELSYPRTSVELQGGFGTLTGSGHGSPGRLFEVVSEVAEIHPALLRSAPPVNAATLAEPETLRMPDGTERVAELALRVAGHLPTPYDRVIAVLDYIERNNAYTLHEEVTPAGEDAITHYLFETRRGACDLSASAAAIMCRAVGVPSRVATGYVAEEPLPGVGGYLVRHEHAHMWVEAFFPGFGWVTFDPSPPLADVNDHVFRTAWFRIQSALRGLGIGSGGLDVLLVLVAVLLTAAVGAVALFSRAGKWLRTRGPSGPAVQTPAAELSRLYRSGMHLLRRRGWSRHPAATPHEFVVEMGAAWGGHPQSAGALTALEALTQQFIAGYYGGEANDSGIEKARAALDELRRQAPHRSRLEKARVEGRTP
jgi:transglutaminase-like putative cysteine protease